MRLLSWILAPNTATLLRAACEVRAWCPSAAVVAPARRFISCLRSLPEAHCYCELYSCLVDVDAVLLPKIATIKGIILSGGPSSVYEEGSPHVSPRLWAVAAERRIPILGICYGFQEMVRAARRRCRVCACVRVCVCVCLWGVLLRGAGARGRTRVAAHLCVCVCVSRSEQLGGCGGVLRAGACAGGPR
jgi:hypothetical protein